MAVIARQGSAVKTARMVRVISLGVCDLVKSRYVSLDEKKIEMKIMKCKRKKCASLFP